MSSFYYAHLSSRPLPQQADALGWGVAMDTGYGLQHPESVFQRADAWRSPRPGQQLQQLNVSMIYSASRRRRGHASPSFNPQTLLMYA